MSDYGYTLVQHSAFGYRRDRTFERAVESRALTLGASRRVREVGGLIFPDYDSAEKYGEEAMYPDGYDGLVPRIGGTFSRRQIDGLAIWVPPAADELHVCLFAPEGERQHEASADCWCKPTCVTAVHVGPTWRHTGEARPAVTESIKAERRTEYCASPVRGPRMASGTEGS